jgi:phosphate-selective porin OprO/OprP
MNNFFSKASKLFLFLFISSSIFCQSDFKEKTPLFSFRNGLGIVAPDSTFSINIRFRIQSRVLMQTKSMSDWSPENWEARVRRARISFAGFVYNNKFTYYFQLAFSRGDMDWSGLESSIQNISPNVLRDALFYFRPIPSIQIGFGQGKLPGNRQRVVSSGSLQFHDRSPVNAAFTLDRDFGVFINYSSTLFKNWIFFFKSAISSGEGRNSITSNTGLAYTGRFEILPMGEFSNGGDYFEGDVARENTPKLSLGIGSHFNDLAVRTQGQLGRDLYKPLSYFTFFADMLYKYKGWALSTEYLERNTKSSPVTMDKTGNIRDLLTGRGLNAQLSYCFPKGWEIAGRYSIVTPSDKIALRVNKIEEMGGGITKYFMKHKTKFQFFVFSHLEKNIITLTEKNNLFWVFQIEAGI